jgi:hypothetical protein
LLENPLVIKGVRVKPSVVVMTATNMLGVVVALQLLKGLTAVRFVVTLVLIVCMVMRVSVMVLVEEAQMTSMVMFVMVVIGGC